VKKEKKPAAKKAVKAAPKKAAPKKKEKKPAAKKKPVAEKKPAAKKAAPKKKPAKTVPKKRKKNWKEEGLEFKIAGISFRTSECKEAVRSHGEVYAGDRCTTRHRASLVPDPTNPYDSNAIKVMISGHHVGFVPKDQTHLVDPSADCMILDFKENKFLGNFQGRIRCNMGDEQVVTEVEVAGEDGGGYDSGYDSVEPDFASGSAKRERKWG